LAYTTRFINDLRDDIHVVILVAHPTTLDTAYTLALLQEEAGEPYRHKDYCKNDHYSFLKFVGGRGGLALPPPPTRASGDKLMGDDKMAGMKQNSIEDKLSMLKNFQHARSLCIRCGDKWAPSHRCAP
jgi:hypothetical protein